MRRIMLSAVAAVFLVQCATATRGPLQRIRVGSRPSGASVQLSECGAGASNTVVTPASVFVNRRATACTLTFTHPDHGVRTIPLLRTGRALGRAPNVEVATAAAGGVAEAAGEMGDAGAVVIALAIPLGAASAVSWGLGRGFDALTGARYEQSHSTILVDFSKPVPKVTGRYKLLAVDGRELPAVTTRTDKCLFRTDSGWLSLEKNGRWSSSIIEQKVCGKKTYRPEAKSANGIYSAEGDQILLESEYGASLAVLQGDRLEMNANALNWTLQKQEDGNEER